MIRPQHTCPEDAAITIQAVCDDGSVGASDVFILIAIVAALAAVAFIVFNLTRKRFLSEEGVQPVPEEEEDEAADANRDKRDG